MDFSTLPDAAAVGEALMRVVDAEVLRSYGKETVVLESINGTKVADPSTAARCAGGASCCRT